ncbi:MAG: hypothetical protein AAGH78_02280 [Cyanobacteria bacterium P01_H01_bin.58]
MEPLQAQVTTLTNKVDALHQAIDQVNVRVSEILSTTQTQAREGSADNNQYLHIASYSNVLASEPTTIHKDILVDATYIDPERSGEETSLSPEVQIQRLTAQLTAAYNRIAALEEQLLASRVHS